MFAKAKKLYEDGMSQKEVAFALGVTRAKIRWLFKQNDYRSRSLRHGRSLMCHGMSGTPTHQSWTHMKQRTTNPNNDRYKDYGGRGIILCDKWKTFEGFLEDMGPRPDGTSIGRRDNNRGYFKGNCRWETREQQQRNRSVNRMIEYKGEILCVAAWAEKLNLPYSCLSTRINRGWSIERAVTQGCS